MFAIQRRTSQALIYAEKLGLMEELESFDLQAHIYEKNSMVDDGQSEFSLLANFMLMLGAGSDSSIKCG